MHAAISANGRFVAFQTDATNLGGPVVPSSAYIYRYDAKRKRSLLVSRKSASLGGGGANGYPSHAQLSASGRVVAFQTNANNLGIPVNSAINVYSYDAERRKLRLASRQGSAAGGAGANQPSFGPSISGDGRSVIFETKADNLGASAQNVFNVYASCR